MKISQKFLRNELAALEQKHELAKNQVAITYGAMQTVEQMLMYCKKSAKDSPTPLKISGPTPEEIQEEEIGIDGDAEAPTNDEDGLPLGGSESQLGV